MAKTPNAIVSQRIEIAPGLIKLRVVPDGWELPDFIPGQYTMLGLPWTVPRHEMADPDWKKPQNPDRFILRSYSVASSSAAKEHLEFYIGMVRSGLLSPRLFTLRAGDKLYMGPKFMGMFTLAEVPDRFNVILIATGTGVAPYMSMIRTEIAQGFQHRFTIIHGACHSSDLGYHDELRALASANPNFDYWPIISRPDEEPSPWPGPVGYVQKLWRDEIVAREWGFRPDQGNSHIFLCGNPHMIDEMTQMLKQEGFLEHTERMPGQIHEEKYFED
jgi:ferredoxin--NADP+ reductase